jgi:hypothetical protein
MHHMNTSLDFFALKGRNLTKIVVQDLGTKAHELDLIVSQFESSSPHLSKIHFNIMFVH